LHFWPRRIEVDVMSDADDEADALVRAAKNDRESFGRLYDRYYPLLHRFCQRRLAGKEGADDVVAEAFLSIARGIREFPGTTEVDFRCWAYRIAANAANLHLRKQMQRRETVGVASEPSIDDSSLRPAHAFELADEFRPVAEALERLDERSRTVVTLRYMEGLEHEHIAQVVELKPAAVRTVLSRALERLRSLLRAERERVAGSRDGGR
jgi:RNA polymerase sigma-70 factor (ECF subfamily)